MKTAEEYIEEFYGSKVPDLFDKDLDPMANLSFNNLVEILNGFANQSRWIDVNTKLPENGQTVMVHTNEEVNGSQFLFSIYSDKYGFESVAQRIITHWQIPLPPTK